MAVGFVIDTTRPRYGEWTFGWWSTGAIQQAYQAWMVRGLPEGMEASDEPSNDPDSGAGSSPTAVPDNPSPSPTGS